MKKSCYLEQTPIIALPMNALKHILSHQLIAIIRGNYTEEDILSIVSALYNAGIRTVEITLNSRNALHFIEKLSDKYAESLLIGAGTVLQKEEVTDAAQAGAQFMLSPHVDSGIIEATKKLGKISIPGGFSPTEILLAHQLGGDLIKVFPARIGAAYIADIRGPYPHIPLIPTGGINLQNVIDFHRAGAAAFGVGSDLVPSNLKVDVNALKQLEAKARNYIDLLSKTIKDHHDRS